MISQPQEILKFSLRSNKRNEAQTLVELFERQVDKTPDALALLSETEAYTYLELDKRANQLARCLLTYGLGKGKFVGIHLDRSIKPIIAILATLKTGAAYIPLDPNYPEGRIEYILSETQISLLITESELEKRLPTKVGEKLFFNDLSFLANNASERLNQQEINTSANDLCYVLFTSGSTGHPKGIMTEHRNVVAFIKSFNKVIRVNNQDRIYQGFSLGFDGSVEEMWTAFSNGATLVVGNPIAAKLPEEAARVMAVLGVTVFSTVPTFLALIKQDIPTLRLIFISGEPCPEKLVNLWVNDKRRMINVYGPTETTVNTTTHHCMPNTTVTIGKPLEGYDIYILDEQLKPVRPGEAGELYIGGIGVSRGYFNNPLLTEKTFLNNPFEKDGLSRIFKTGDKVRLAANGELEFIGRLDTQVKIRGFRVDLAEIEAILHESPLVDHVAVLPVETRGSVELAAYVIPKCGKDQFDFVAILSLLKKRVPAYMIPSHLELMDEFPRLASGKIARKSFPPPQNPLVVSDEQFSAPSNELEQKLVEVWKKIFKLEQVSTASDFFIDLGGYSLLAVEMVTLLREEYNLELSIRDLYHLKTIKALVADMQKTRKPSATATAKAPDKSAKEIFHTVPAWERFAVYTLQLFTFLGFTLYLSGISAAITWFFIAAVKGVFTASTISLGVLAFLFLYYPLHLLLCIGLKRLIIGRFKPGKYPLWSFYYFKFWLVSKIQAAAFSNFLVGTPIMSLYYRLMGAKVGSNTLINTTECVIFDQVQIGKETSIGKGTQLLGYRIENSQLIIGEIHIGDRCFIGDHSCLGLNSSMANDSLLGDLSLLPDNFKTEEKQAYAGSPAQPGEVALPELPALQQRRRPFLYGLIHFLMIEVLGAVLTGVMLPLFTLLLFGGYQLAGVSGLFLGIALNLSFGFVLFCSLVLCLKKVIMPKTPVGLFDTQSFVYVRLKMIENLLSVSAVLLHNVYTTIYLPPWLRLLGASIGKRAELSTIVQANPDLLTIGDESFLADGSMISTGRIYRSFIELKENKIGNRSFIGNNAYLLQGRSLGNHSLIGVLSTSPIEHEVTADNSEWLGSPSFLLPFRKKINSFSLKETFKPTIKLYAIRCVIDGLRILLPNAINMVNVTLFSGLLVWAILEGISLPRLLFFLPLAVFTLALSALFSVVILKKAIMGVFKPEIKPLWCVYIWLNELINGLHETVATPILQTLLGTPFLNWYFRLLGCKIGKHTYLGTTLFSEFDLVEIGDYACLNRGVVIQNHLFEDRIFKSSTVKIGHECSIGNMSIVLYDTEIKANTIIGPLSLVMKGESLPKASKWLGIPINKMKE